MQLTQPPVKSLADTYTNVLSLDLINDAYKFVETQTTSRTNFTSWNQAIVRNSNAVLVYDLSGELKDRITAELRNRIPDLNNFEFLHPMYYKWMPGSYIPWHSDFSWKFGVTVYLNEVWNENWGGYFAYKTGNDVWCVKPEFNCATRIHTPIEHTVFSTTPDAPARNTIQVFGK